MNNRRVTILTWLLLVVISLSGNVRSQALTAEEQIQQVEADAQKNPSAGNCHTAALVALWQGNGEKMIRYGLTGTSAPPENSPTAERVRMFCFLDAYIGYLKNNDVASASDLMKRAIRECNRSEWPYPLLRFFAGETEIQTVNESFANDTEGQYKPVVNHFYLGAANLALGRVDEAKAEFLTLENLKQQITDPDQTKFTNAWNDIAHQLLEKIDPNHRHPQKAVTDVDFGPYMSKLEKRMKKNWFPPRGQESRKVTVIVKLSRDGTVKDLRLEKPSGVQTADEAALAAVRKGAPYAKLPVGAPEVVDIQFTFDYNVLSDSDKSQTKATSD